MTLTKAQKLFSTLLAIGGLVSIAGTYVYLPKRLDDVKSEVKQLSYDARVDHDRIVRIEEKVSNVERALNRNNINALEAHGYYDAVQFDSYTNVEVKLSKKPL